MPRKCTLVPLILAGIALGGTNALAQPAMPSDGPEIIIVRYLKPSKDRLICAVNIGDLDLKTSAGRDMMEMRVSAAVKDMCAVPTPLPTYGDEMARPCTDEAWASAKPQMTAAVARAGAY